MPRYARHRRWRVFDPEPLRVSAVPALITYRGRDAVSAATHNELVPELVKRLIKGTDSESDAMVALESVVLGVMLFYAPRPGHAAEFLEVLTERVIERMRDNAARAN